MSYLLYRASDRCSFEYLQFILHKYFSTYYSPNNIKMDCSCHEHGYSEKEIAMEEMLETILLDNSRQEKEQAVTK